jgi:penicillin V acylase-like amidase (Ntn superfamily)
MKQKITIMTGILFSLLGGALLKDTLFSCSTFMFKKPGQLIFAHNLDQPGIHVPGFIIINKRGIYKSGKSENQLFAKSPDTSVNLDWISKYGSVTFNIFGKEMADGGMNEAGLYIWEMSDVQAQNVKTDSVGKLYAPNWMQYILDNYRNTEEAVRSLSRVVPEGMTWHYFLADRSGNCAIIDFEGGQPTIYKKEQMPVPGLFNRPYSQELKRLTCFEGYGGHYPIELQDKHVPRIAHTAKMLWDYKAGVTAVGYSFDILEILGGGKSDWSVVFDVNEQMVYFRTELNPETKYFSTKQLDFSNRTPCLFLDIEIKEAGDVTDNFSVLHREDHMNMIKKTPFPESMKTAGGLSLQEFNSRWFDNFQISLPSLQNNMRGTWIADISISNQLIRRYYPGLLQNDRLILDIRCHHEAVNVHLSNRNGQLKRIPGENVSLNLGTFSATFRLQSKIFRINSRIQDNKMTGVLSLDGLDLEKVEFRKMK